jgi:hypothetical protein
VSAPFVDADCPGSGWVSGLKHPHQRAHRGPCALCSSCPTSSPEPCTPPVGHCCCWFSSVPRSLHATVMLPSRSDSGSVQVSSLPSKVLPCLAPQDFRRTFRWRIQHEKIVGRLSVRCRFLAWPLSCWCVVFLNLLGWCWSMMPLFLLLYDISSLASSRGDCVEIERVMM